MTNQSASLYGDICATTMDGRNGYMKPIALGLIKAYKVAVSPYMPGQCRYSPSCSEYAADAVEAYGVVRGAAMTAKRLVRCRPGVEGGYDPAVPDAEFDARTARNIPSMPVSE